MNRLRLMILVGLLLGAGLGIFVWKWQVLGFPLVPDARTEVWTVEARLRFEPGPGPVKARMRIPGLTPGFAILEENFVSRGFGFTTDYVQGGREVEWTVRRARGAQTLYYRSVLYRDPTRAASDTLPPFPPTPSLGEPFDTAAAELVDQVREQSADPESFTTGLLKRLSGSGSDQNVELLLGPAPSDTDVARTAIELLAVAQIPARLIRGLLLAEQQRQAEPVPWLQIHNGDSWVYFDPATGDQGLPDNFLVWWYGNEPLFRIDGGSAANVDLSVRANLADPVAIAQSRARARSSWAGGFSLFDLPIQTQAVYSILLLVPLGAVVVVILRNVIGVSTFGTFMPVLIALAFKETQLLWGAILFSSLVIIGLTFRFALERLRLLLIPRLGAVLIIVVILMLLVSLVSHRLGLETGLSVALFPMVILAMTIERMSVVWEERGSSEAMKQGLGSLGVAVVCYLVMGITALQHLLFVFPELLLALLALAILTGRYTGYRLSELFRFRDLTSQG